ncbi:MAG: ATP-binding protein [Armatimonadetes bacterium]|nr:ATP-binding protein [Armatimonadota bacterium]
MCNQICTYWHYMQYYLHMIRREFWIRRIEELWEQRSVLWLQGVRRVGKTTLCRSLEDVEYFDCELPRIRRQMEDPEATLAGLKGKRVVLDEVHRLRNPSEVLKIAADYFPTTKVLATGSSTLQTSTKFRDTLTGRKFELWLTPLMSADLVDFGNQDLQHRLLHGGLPPFFLSEDVPERDFQEWMDSYWAKDIQELFRLERRSSFQRFVELLLASSGGMFEATRYASPCEISRSTVANYLSVLEATRVVHVLRPFTTRKSTEIVSAPKVYAFDTGFVCHGKDWLQLRSQDFGYLWEHYVLNELQSHGYARDLHYWRDTRGHEVDFVLVRRGQSPIAIECKWSAWNLEWRNLRSFRQRYPDGENWLVAADVDRPFRRLEGDLDVEFMGLSEMTRRLERKEA